MPPNRAPSTEQFRSLLREVYGMPTALISELEAIAFHETFCKGQMFLRAGEVPELLGFNLNGIFRLFYVDQEGNDFTKGFSQPGNLVISYSALAQNRESYFNIEAIADSEVMLVNYQSWMRIVQENIEWYPFLYRMLQTVYIAKEMREKAFLLDDARTRYLEFRKQFHGLEGKLKQYHVASYLGIASETLSRIRRELKIT